jgi:predicted TIM-barrel fold metal-dependent hydrolase
MRITLLLLTLCSFFTATAQLKMDFETYTPTNTLVVPEHHLTKSKFPFIDVHNHQSNMGTQDLGDLIRDMDRMNMKVMVNLTGIGGDALTKMTTNIREHQPNRFIVFTNINFSGIGEDGWTEKAVKQLEQDVKNGANGLKIFKNLGLSVRDKSGKRVAVDDIRLDAIWEKAGQLKIPVLIHTADPKPFWDSLDEKNERWSWLRIRVVSAGLMILNPGRS